MEASQGAPHSSLLTIWMGSSDWKMENPYQCFGEGIIKNEQKGMMPFEIS